MKWGNYAKSRHKNWSGGEKLLVGFDFLDQGEGAEVKRVGGGWPVERTLTWACSL